MEKSSTSPVANAISNGDKHSCSHTPGEGPGRDRGELEFCRLGESRFRA